MCKRIALVFVALIVSACSSVPESIRVEESQSLIPYQVVVLNPDKHIGDAARWGGVIARVENLQDQTMVEVVHQELSSSGRPHGSDFSAGRFRVYVQGFLDPVVFAEGRSITFVGQIAALEQGAIGEQSYTFPVLLGESYNMWQDRQQVDVDGISFGVGLWPYSYRSYWSNWYYPHLSMGPYHQRVIIRDTSQPSGGGNLPVTRSTESSSQSDTKTQTPSRPRTTGMAKHKAERLIDAQLRKGRN